MENDYLFSLLILLFVLFIVSMITWRIYYNKCIYIEKQYTHIYIKSVGDVVNFIFLKFNIDISRFFSSFFKGFYNLTLLGNDLILMKRNLLPLISETLSLPECTAEVSLINLQLLLALMYASGTYFLFFLFFCTFFFFWFYFLYTICKF